MSEVHLYELPILLALADALFKTNAPEDLYLTQCVY